jgi:hypothetical protein
MRKVVPCLLGALAMGIIALGVYPASGQDKPKYDISEVMQKAHKGGLLKKVTGGNASAEEKTQLLEYYTALSQNKPPKGDEKEFKKRTDPIVAAAKEVVAGKEGAEAKLSKAVNCKDCHAAHRN